MSSKEGEEVVGVELEQKEQSILTNVQKDELEALEVEIAKEFISLNFSPAASNSSLGTDGTGTWQQTTRQQALGIWHNTKSRHIQLLTGNLLGTLQA